MDISLIICTCNRHSDLQNTLESLENVEVPPHLQWEILVVDNNSTDSTKTVVEDIINKGHGICRYIFEGQQGKSYALNRGLAEVTGKIIAFIDDDIIVGKEWLITIREEFESDLTLDVLGGRVELYNEKDKPLTIRNSHKKRQLTRHTFKPRFIPILGCNMAMRREVVDKVGLFDTQLGPGSKKNAVVEDVDFLYRASRVGLRIMYSPSVVVFHNHGRSLDSELDKVRRGYLIGRGAFYRKYISTGDRYILKLACWELYGVLKNMIKTLLSMRSVSKEIQVIKFLFIGAISYK